MIEDGDSIFIEVTVDHFRFVIDEAYRERMCREVMALHLGKLTMVDEEHEQDESCCRLEPWGTTLARLLPVE